MRGQRYTPGTGVGSVAVVQPGDQVGQYEVERLLGSGGMADVWQVRHRVLGARYALKCLQRQQPDLVQRLLQEGRAQAQLRHPALLPVHEILEADGQPALLMPLVDGPTLDRLLLEHRPRPEEALAIFSALLEGLGAAHQMGFVHRDLKPSNILLQLKPGRLQPRISDFGLVKRAGANLTITGAVFGTPAYAAPEQLRDAAQASPRSDLFSMGVLFVELLGGQRPFAGTSLFALYEAHQKAPDLSALTAPFQAIAARLLARDPAQRPPSCADVQALLGDVTDEPLQAGKPLWRAASALRRSLAPDPPRADQMGIYSMLGGRTTFAAVAHNLPEQRDRFIGRGLEQRRLRNLLLGSRIVTVTGFGGIGKSRLVTEVAHSLLSGDWPGGIWFVPLADVRTADGIRAGVAAALGVPLGQGGAAQLAASIRARGRMLLILDNFEQITAFAEETVGSWLDGAPEVVVLATSREPLWVRGERLFALDPFGREDAIALFVDRALASSRRFRPESVSDADMDELVRLLDGLPLAIELAAARVRMFSPAALCARLRDRMDLLSSKSRVLPARQRTLRATMQWSWDLLKPWERDALAQASVFENGFTVEAAAEVLDLPAASVQGLWVEDVLAELVDKHLLIADGDGRMRMLVSIQHFAAEHLTDRAAAEQRHGHHFAEMGTLAARREYARSHAGSLRTLLAEADNLAVAAQRAEARGDIRTAAMALFAMDARVESRGPQDRYLPLLESVAAHPSPWQAVLVAMAGHSRWNRGSLDEARQHCARALALAEETNNQRGACLAQLLALALSVYDRDPAAACAAYARALALAEALGDDDLTLSALNCWVDLARVTGDYEQGIKETQRALALARRTGNGLREANALQTLGVLRRNNNQFSEAQALFEQALVQFQQQGNISDTAVTQLSLSRVIRQYGDWARAASLLEGAQRVLKRTGQRTLENTTLRDWASLLFQMRAIDRAEAKTRDALRHSQELGQPMCVAFCLLLLADIAMHRNDLAAASRHLEDTVASMEQSNHPVVRYMFLRRWCDVYRAQKDFARAQAKIAAADALAARIPRGLVRVDLCCAQVRLRFDLGEREAARQQLAELEAIIPQHLPPYHSNRWNIQLTHEHLDAQ